MDGTLIDSEKLWDISLADLADHLGGTLTAPARRRMVGSNLEATMLIMFEELDLDPEPESLGKAANWLTERTGELFRDELRWRPGAREALASLRASGVPMALVTSTQRPLTEVALDTIGREHFQVTVCGDEVDGRNKPDPEPYLKAARLLGLDAGACVAVEDSPVGLRSAVAAGCRVVVVPSEVPIPPGEGYVVRESLAGVDAGTLATLTMDR